MLVRQGHTARRRYRLLASASAGVLGLFVTVAPADAQMARLRGAVGAAPVVTTTPTSTAVPLRGQRMQDALAAQAANRATVQSMKTMVTAARSAALAAVRVKPTDGLSTHGLDPAVTKPVLAADDSTGLATWQGADLPTQSVDGGKYTVTIKQTDSRALLSWNSFNVGADTTLHFDQTVGGKAQTSWVVLNRVVDPKASPTTILGQIKADGTVLILNRAGVIFGEGAQVNTHSLLASSLEIGNYAKDAPDAADPGNSFRGLTIKERNAAYLENGLLGPAATTNKFATMITSALAGTGTYSLSNPSAAFSTQVEGNVVVDRGASINASGGGFVILTAPNVSNDGTITAPEGQVSLQAGRAISYTISTGDANGVDPDIRGLLLRSTTETGGIAVNSGLIEVKRGYISLGADLTGTVTNSGLLTSTTSVSRNGAISLTAGHVVIAAGEDPAHAGGIAILEDDNGETLPQGTAGSPPNFKTSRIDIGGMYVSPTVVGVQAGLLGPAQVDFGANSLLLAPSANVSIGGRASQAWDPQVYLGQGHAALDGDITVAAGAIIDVSGVKDVAVSSSRNTVQISPLKGNELRDTPNYRDVKTDGSFTLNGKTVYLDPRKSGVRADGVKWIGSPLIEAGSAVSQIGVTAAELMSKGGTVTFAVKIVDGAVDPSTAPKVDIAKGATVDFSGGWVRYDAGWVRESRLIRADGTLVPISEADPNGDYVGIADSYDVTQSRVGKTETFSNRALNGSRFEAAYDEGHDAGGMVVRASTGTIDATLHGDAFAGAQQLSGSALGSATSTIARDPRKLQGTARELPSGGFLRVGSFSGASGIGLGGDIMVRAEGASPLAVDPGSFVLSDKQLSAAGLSALTLQTSGKVTLASGSNLVLANGGALTIDAGRTITLGGDVTAHGGTISARTYELGGIVLQSSIASLGSAFSAADDIKDTYAIGEALPDAFDVVVDGTLDVSGLWSNDLLAAGGLPVGNAYVDGGSITLAVAPKVLVALGSSFASATDAADLTGDLLINKGALLNVSSGGYVNASGALSLDAKGGNVTLLNETVYASLSRTDPFLDATSSSDLSIGGENQSVTFKPYDNGEVGKTVRSALAPSVQRSVIRFDASNFKGFSFGGGGKFTLVAPDIALGGAKTTDSAWLGLDFLQKTGFGALDLTAWKSRNFTDLFDNGVKGVSAFLDTTTFTIHDGETLNLTQALMPSVLDPAQAAKLAGLATGADVTAVVSAAVPQEAWDQRAASLTLGGLTELDVEQGGRIIAGSARADGSIAEVGGASLTVAKLFNDGDIRLLGGSILQRSVVPEVLYSNAIGVQDPANGGTGLDAVLGQSSIVDGHVQYRGNARSVADPSLTNNQLFSLAGRDKTVYFLGKLDAATGLRFGAQSTTDLSGGVVLNPRSAVLAGGRRLVTGTLYGGGSIKTSASYLDSSSKLFSSPAYGAGRTQVIKAGAALDYAQARLGLRLQADAGATIDISGAAADLDVQTGPSSYALTPQWSNGGTLSVLAGGSIAGATIDADGGASAAEGGVLEWLTPTLVQSYGDGASTLNVLAADQIAQSGFDTLVARRTLGLTGGVTLKLGKALILSSADAPSASPQERDFQSGVVLQSNGDARIEAPYIRLSSRAQTVPNSLSTTAQSGSITFAANNIDLVGAIRFVVPGTAADGASPAGTVNLKAVGDIRLTGVAPAIANTARQIGLTGAVVSNGDLSFTARQIYATTGTGNLQQLIEDRRNGTSNSAALPYLVASLGKGGTVSFASNGGAVPDSPLSAGSWVRVLGANIHQDGVLRAPLGLLEIGSSNGQIIPGTLILAPATENVVFGKGSVTSVSGAGLKVPYGQTTDLTEYYFTPSTTTALTAAPTGELLLAGKTIDVQSGAKIDGQGGGDIFAYEFVSGTGGSRDVLSRFNSDTFSSNDGFQYADGRQVYAILPVSKAGEIADYDPLYAQDYGAGGGDLYGLNAGRTVWLDAAPGVEAGEYLLLPAHYALLPGALRLVENTSAAAPYAGASATLRDGSTVVGGSYATAGTGLRESARRSFTVQSSDTFLDYAKITVTSGTTTFDKLADKQGLASPRSPLDAARFVITPGASFTVNGTFEVDAAEGGRGAQFDIAANAIAIRDAAAGSGDTGVLTLSAATLSNLDAESLLIGGVRRENANGTTTIGVVAHDLTVGGDVSLALPELILAVGGENSNLTVAGGASLVATGKLADQNAAAYTVGYSEGSQPASGADNTGIGSLLRVANGTERLVNRSYDPLLDGSAALPSTLTVGAGVKLAGDTIAFDSTRAVKFTSGITIDADAVSLTSSSVSFGANGLASDIAGQLAGAKQLTLRSANLIKLGSTLPASFNNLVIDGPGLGASEGDATINATSVTFRNTGDQFAGCGSVSSASCNLSAKLTVAADTISFGSGRVGLVGYKGGVSLSAAKGISVQGQGALVIDETGAASGVSLDIRAPFIADRSLSNAADLKSGGADYSFLTTGAVTIDGTGLTGTIEDKAVSAGSIISFGSEDKAVSALTIKNADVRASAGVINAFSRGTIAVSGDSTLSAPGFQTKIGTAEDGLIATAGSGSINLKSIDGSITFGSATSLVVDTGLGNAGSLTLLASHGDVVLAGTLNAGIGTKERGASLTIAADRLLGDQGKAFSLGEFVTSAGNRFEGDLAIHVGSGDLALGKSQTMRAASVLLATDSGQIRIDGTIDTRGDDVSKLKMTDAAYTASRVNGGDISLFGADGVTLGGQSVLQTGTSGYAAQDSRQAHAGNVTIGITSDAANISIAQGALIDVGAKNTSARLVAQTVKDPETLNQSVAYRSVDGDLGGAIIFRAPLVSGTVSADLDGTIKGASSLTIDAFKRFDLDALAASGTFGGITKAADGSIHLDAGATGARPNFLASIGVDGSLPDFIRNFSVALKNGKTLDGYRLRPEAELVSANDIVLDSNINLGAGQIKDVDGALAAGLLKVSPLGPDAAGNPRYEVVSGKEAELFARYVDMTFRVGGAVTGEAGIFSLRSAGNLQITRSISDGFFAFHDRTDADYLSYQLGGGDRVYHPGVLVDCADGSTCDYGLPSYSEYLQTGKRPSDDEIVHIDLTSGLQGGQSTPVFINSPYSASANSVAANGTGNGIGIGELFPLVDGKAVSSSDIRLVAGSNLASADPTGLDRSAKGSVTIAGEQSYRVVAKAGKATLGDTLQLGFDDGSGTLLFANANKFLTGDFNDYVDSATAGDYFTRLDWGKGTALSDETRQAALTYFAGHKFITRGGEIVGVYASLDEVTQFLSGKVGSDYVKLNTDIDIEKGTPVSYDQKRVYFRPVVRTGDGNISIAAATDVDLVGSGAMTYRDEFGASRDSSGELYGQQPDAAQVGGSAVYTAGVRLPKLGSIDTSAIGSEKVNYIPSPQGLLDHAPAVTGKGGDVTIEAGRDVIGRRDVWSESYLGSAADIESDLPGYEAGVATLDPTRVGSASQRWRVGSIGLDSSIGVVAQLFTSGVGALAGGDVTIRAARDIGDLTVALDNSVVTDRTANGARVLVTSASGNLRMDAGRDLLGGQVDVASGIGLISAGRSVAAAGETLTTGSYDNESDIPDTRNLLRLRVADATIALTARSGVDLGGIGALGAERAEGEINRTLNSAGFFSPIAGVSIDTIGQIDLTNNRKEMRVPFVDIGTSQSVSSFLFGYVLPPSLALHSLSSDLVFGNSYPGILYPSKFGQLSLVAGGDLSSFALAMSDANPSDLPGAFTVASFSGSARSLFRNSGLGFTFGGTYGAIDDPTLRLYHDRSITHADDTRPAEVYAGGSITDVQLVLAKAARVNAGGDIVNLAFEGQNLRSSDITSIIAGGDITATTSVPGLDTAFAGRPYVNVTNFILGGPGSLVVQAGRDLGPFLNSATVNGVNYAGGIRTIGNEANPWLGTTGADITALFGVAHGANYAGLASTYLDPANLAKLDGDLFVQNVDAAGNRTPDRAKPIYAAKLALWLKANAPELYASVFADLGTSASDAQVSAAAYGRMAELYQAFTNGLSAERQHQFLIREVYFGEIAAPADPNGPSYQQYVRGYRAIQTLFPAEAGYTDNLSTFETDPSTVSTDHPLGEPTKKLVDGEPAVATRVLTGNVDLRLATIQTARGGSIDILGPGGDFIAGSVVRTSEQAARKTTPYSGTGLFNLRNGFASSIVPIGISSIPIGYEGVLSLRGGAIRSFTDGDFRLNQSRLFSLSGGDITMWSSNGDLNAGQGPKTASNFPPIVLRFFPDGFAEVDTAGSVAGAGIAAFRPSLDIEPSRITLLAPVGTVDAGDAGVRASGDVFVAAARVANADNFKVGGVSVGVPTAAVVAAPAVPASATAAATATAAQAGAQKNAEAGDRQSIIRVDVLGYIGSDAEPCPSGKRDANGKCEK
ncbi:filamentous haemagglutinin family protein [Novosphingobium huizhouense]|uniref:filamentous haemagglutinin family protein n=1 Tax=Novosphingobium huizhouense TaxID=2866625 RepID=UPI001CD85C3A|nr:filamentous haemagglutinin family protein [Novosphingobium huizhouense]